MTKIVFKLSTKKKNEKSRYIIAKGNGLKLSIAEYGGEKKWYRPEGERLRTKQKKFWYMFWNTENLSKIFGTKITHSTRYTAGDVYDSSELIRHVPLKEWINDLNLLAKGLGANIKFE